MTGKSLLHEVRNQRKAKCHFHTGMNIGSFEPYFGLPIWYFPPPPQKRPVIIYGGEWHQREIFFLEKLC
jgi:hypothetical protein